MYEYTVEEKEEAHLDRERYYIQTDIYIHTYIQKRKDSSNC